MLLGGFKSPSDVSIPRTNVPEFAEVTKKVHTKSMVIIDNNIPNGYLENTINIPVSGAFVISSRATFAKIPNSPKCIPNVPKIANHNNEPKDGAKTTPIINSLIVLPFEILAIKIPTNGAHAIHQAQ